MTPYEHLDALITSAYLNEPDDRVYRALMAQRDVEIQRGDREANVLSWLRKNWPQYVAVAEKALKN